MKSGNLNFLEHSGPLHACDGTALPNCNAVAAQKLITFGFATLEAVVRWPLSGFCWSDSTFHHPTCHTHCDSRVIHWQCTMHGHLRSWMSPVTASAIDVWPNQCVWCYRRATSVLTHDSQPTISKITAPFLPCGTNITSAPWMLRVPCFYSHKNRIIVLTPSHVHTFNYMHLWSSCSHSGGSTCQQTFSLLRWVLHK
jgi:hypothetical protein